MKPSPDPPHRRRFPAEIIRHAVWLYHVFSLSLRDVELLLAERGVVVSYESICPEPLASIASDPAVRRWRRSRRCPPLAFDLLRVGLASSARLQLLIDATTQVTRFGKGAGLDP